MILGLLSLAELIFLYFLSRSLTQTIYSIFYGLFHSRSFALGVLTMLYLPGTIIHELSHLIFAEVLRVPTGEISFVPKVEEINPKNTQEPQTIKMGYVKIGNSDPLRRYLIGFAPVLLGLFFLFLLIWLFQRFWPEMHNWKEQVLLITIIGYFLFSISNNMFSSKKDLEGFLIFLPIILLVCIILYLMGLRITLTGTALELSQQILLGLTKSLSIITAVNLTILVINRFILRTLRKN